MTITATKIMLMSLFIFVSPFTMANDEANSLLAIQKRWAEVNYSLEGKAQLAAFETLIERLEKQKMAEPTSAPVWIWSGIVKSTYAGAKGGLGALSYAKASKHDLEQAIVLDGNALEGSAYTSLGTLYFNVPGWPIGFGDDDKAEALLLKALDINPEGVDSNYFYGSYLMSEGHYKEAKHYMLKAEQAPKRPDRPIADAGRMEEITLALAKIHKKLNK